MAEISVIVPVYTVENYLRECIDSILAQTYCDFELILIDDGSSDKSGEICDLYSEKDSRIRVLHQKNTGQAEARNHGVSEANTDLLCFIDSDDIVNPLLLEKFIDAFRKYDVGVVACDRIEGEKPPEDFFQKISGEVDVFHIDEACLLRLFEENQTIYWTLFPCLLKKTVYKKYPLHAGRIMEDNAVACKWLTEADCVAVVHVPLYFYRINHNGTMNVPFNMNRLDFLWALEEQLSFCEIQGFNNLRGAIAKEYVLSSLYLAEKVNTELHMKKEAKSIIKKAVRIRKCFKKQISLDSKERDKLFRTAHPILARLRKKIKVN